MIDGLGIYHPHYHLSTENQWNVFIISYPSSFGDGLCRKERQDE